MRVSTDDLKQATFGVSDGATGAVGLIGTLWVSNHHSAIALAVMALAVAAAISMAGSEFISDTSSSVRKALVMGFATLLGGLIPGVPFLFGTQNVVLALSAGLTIMLGGAVSWVRARTTGWSVAVLEVFGIFFVVSVATVTIGLIAGSSGS